MDKTYRSSMKNSDVSFATAKSSELAFLYPTSPSHTFFRTLELLAYADFEMRGVVLDLGCGEGGFGSVLFGKSGNKLWLVGIDLSRSELRKAQQLQVYDSLIVADLRELPIRSASIRTIVSNSVLEHVLNFDVAVREIARCLRARGRFYGTFVTEYILLGLVSLPRPRSPKIRTKVENLILRAYNRAYTLRQANFVEPAIFVSTLIDSGLRVVRIMELLSRRALLVWHWLHVVTLISQIISILGDPLLSNEITRATALWGLRYASARPSEGSRSNIFIHAEKAG